MRLPSYRVLGVRIHAVQIPEAVEMMRRWIREPGPTRMVAVSDMHSVMEAQHDPSHRTVLNEADLNVADGWPVMFLGRLLRHPMRRRVYGPELMETFLASARGTRHFFYGGAPGVAEELGRQLQDRFGIEVVGTHSPPFGPLALEEDPSVLDRINASRPDVVWVGLGAPKQERWMASRRRALRAPVVVGVGAAFDFLTGRVRQAPEWMREHGLEWFFRFLTQPRRLAHRYLVRGGEFAVRVLTEVCTGGFREGRVWTGKVG